MRGVDNESKATLLVVEDEKPLRTLLARWLRDAGYACLEANDATEAWKCLRTNEVHLLTLDITLPGGSGLDLVPEIKRAFPDTQILMVTASADAATAVEALTDGANAYLFKPVKRKELLHHVERGTERRRLLVENRLHTQRLERQVREQTLVIRQAHEETIHRLVAASGYRDEETGAHVRRTGLFSEVLARAAGWSAAESETLRFAAPMHDVGKIGVPDQILRKPGRLTSHEYEVMKRHTLIGAKILADSSSPLLKTAAVIALYHHERWDGHGYPHGLAREAIPEAARIVAIADVYDALSHDRVYRSALPVDEVLEMMAEGLGSQFDPTLLPIFFAVHEEIERIAGAVPDESQCSISVPRAPDATTVPLSSQTEVLATP